jgi:hypothetical protein
MISSVLAETVELLCILVHSVNSLL